MLVRNLLDNAVRYSPPSARIKAGVQPRHGQVTLSVENRGPGRDDADSTRLGERLFRVTGSFESGSGLGWSIVARLAAVHRLEIEVGHSTELGALAVHVILNKK